MGASKKHHHSPQFYLKGFTLEGTKEGRLWVLDQVLKRAHIGSPAEDGYQKNFHKIDRPGVDPMQVEKDLANKVESQQATVLADIIESKNLPICGWALNVFLNFIAFSIARTPPMRELVAKQWDAAQKKSLRDFLASPGGAECFQEKCDKEHEISFEQIVEFANSDKFTISADQTTVVESMFMMHEAFLPAASQHYWNLWFVGDGAPDLITSDCPVFPCSKSDMVTPLRQNGLMHWYDPTVVILMPLNRRMVAVGDILCEPAVRTLGEVEVGALNQHVSKFARNIYSSSETFYMVSDGRLGIANMNAFMQTKS